MRIVVVANSNYDIFSGTADIKPELKQKAMKATLLLKTIEENDSCETFPRLYARVRNDLDRVSAAMINDGCTFSQKDLDKIFINPVKVGGRPIWNISKVYKKYKNCSDLVKLLNEASGRTVYK